MTENYPKIIYKYRSWDNELHRNILLKNEVYMSPPKDFNDPFDCRIPKNHYLIDTPEKIEKYINDGIDKHREWLIANGKNIEFEKKQLKERLQDIETYQGPIPNTFVNMCNGDEIKGRLAYSKCLYWRKKYKVDMLLDTPQHDFFEIKELSPHYIHGMSKDGCAIGK